MSCKLQNDQSLFFSEGRIHSGFRSVDKTLKSGTGHICNTSTICPVLSHYFAAFFAASSSATRAPRRMVDIMLFPSWQAHS